MDDLIKQLQSDFDGLEISITYENRITISTKKESILLLLSYLKRMGYDHLAIISCNDWIKDSELELIYIVSHYPEKDPDQYGDIDKRNIIIKTRISREKARFATIMDVFENAEPYERELHEMFGIYFEGHPRLTQLMLERDYKIPPFRKDFDTKKYANDLYGKIPTIEERKKGKE